MNVFRHFAVFCFGLMLSPWVFAAESTDSVENTTKLSSVSPVSTSTLIETLVGLLLVLATIAFVAWLLRRTNSFTSSANGQMKIIAGLPLGPRERAVLIQVGDKQILVGVTAQHVQTLHVLDTPLDSNSADSNNTSFAERLQQMIKQRGES